MINTTIEKIYKEFVALKNLLSEYSPRVTENESLLQFDFKGLNSKDILIELSKPKYFEVYIDNQSPSFIIEQLNTPGLGFTLDELKLLNCRIKYSKDTSYDYVKNLDYYFFNLEEATNFITESSFENSQEILHIGLYNVPSFNTPVFQFTDILNETNYNHNKEINPDILEKINRLLNNTDSKFNYYNNVFSFKCDPNEVISDFQKAIVREYYKAFFKLLSYKETDGNYDIRGKKNIIINLNTDFSITNYNEFISLTDFLFNDDKFLEKYIIVKNVFTRYVHDKENFSSIDSKIIEINKTTKYYFEKYVQEDLKDFFKNRDTVFKEAINVSKSINEQNDKINTYINASLISFLILAISYIFKGVTSLGLDSLVIAFCSLLVFSFSFYRYIEKSSKERFKTTEIQFTLFLNKMGIILLAEKKELLETYLMKPNEDLNKSLDRIKTLLIFANIILLTITITTFIYSRNTP